MAIMVYSKTWLILCCCAYVVVSIVWTKLSKVIDEELQLLVKCAVIPVTWSVSSI